MSICDTFSLWCVLCVVHVFVCMCVCVCGGGVHVYVVCVQCICMAPHQILGHSWCKGLDFS